MSFIAGYLLGLEDGSGSGAPLTIIPKTITENGEYNAADDNADGYNPVTVSITQKIGALSVSENGTYYAADYGLDGFDPVNVNVPDRYDEGYEDGKNDGYEEGKSDGYDSGYDDAFELAKGYYSDTADTSKAYYVWVGVTEPEYYWAAGGDVNSAFLKYYDTETMTGSAASFNPGASKAFDVSIVSVKWVSERRIEVKTRSYNKDHSETYILRWGYTLPEGYNSTNTAIGSADPTSE